MPSFTLLGQALISGVLIGGLYGLLALALTLSWGLLHLVNLTYFALAFVGAYLTYQFGTFYGIPPWYSALILIPAFFVFGVVQQWLLARFRVSGLSSLLVTFGMFVIIEAVIHIVWTADYLRYEVAYGAMSLRLGTLRLPVVDLVVCLGASALAVGVWAWLRWSYTGLALRASAEDPAIAAAYGVNHQFQSFLLAGICAGSAALAGVFIALITTLAPIVMFTWFGVVFAVVIIGGLGNPLGALVAGFLIGVTEAFTMTLISPAWAPVVTFSVLILLLLWRPKWL